MLEFYHSDVLKLFFPRFHGLKDSLKHHSKMVPSFWMINSGLYYLNNKIYIDQNCSSIFSSLRRFAICSTNSNSIQTKKHTSSADRHHDFGLYFWISIGGLSLWRTKMSTIGSLNVDGSTLDASLLGIIFTMARHHHDDHSNLFHGETVESYHKNSCK